MVSSVENNDQLLAPLSFFIKNPISPLSKGININKTGIIISFNVRNVGNMEMWKLETYISKVFSSASAEAAADKHFHIFTFPHLHLTFFQK